jgi:hypothetical protein
MPLRRLHDRIGFTESDGGTYSEETMTATAERPTVHV